MRLTIHRHWQHIAWPHSAVAIGNFDGMHAGHTAVIAAMQEIAASQHLCPSVLTFTPHPRRFFAPQTPPFALETMAQRLQHFRRLGIKNALVARFDARLACLDAEEFIRDVLFSRLNARAVVVGEDFVFGHRRSGSVALLQNVAAQHGVAVVAVPPVKSSGQVCSSSVIRAAIAEGDMRQAALLMGRAYALWGRVVHGDARGRTLGFPTANLTIAPSLLLPALGVYAATVRLPDGSIQPSVVNLGRRPTVSQQLRPSLEVHVLDWQGDLYGTRMRVALHHFIRQEQQFENIAALQQRIHMDCALAREWLAAHPDITGTR